MLPGLTNTCLYSTPGGRSPLQLSDKDDEGEEGKTILSMARIMHYNIGNDDGDDDVVIVVVAMMIIRMMIEMIMQLL